MLLLTCQNLEIYVINGGNLKDYKKFLVNFFIKFLLRRELDVSAKRQCVKKES